jgi:hypothetical protein
MTTRELELTSLGKDAKTEITKAPKPFDRATLSKELTGGAVVPTRSPPTPVIVAGFAALSLPRKAEGTRGFHLESADAKASCGFEPHSRHSK